MLERSFSLRCWIFLVLVVPFSLAHRALAQDAAAVVPAPPAALAPPVASPAESAPAPAPPPVITPAPAVPDALESSSLIAAELARMSNEIAALRRQLAANQRQPASAAWVAAMQEKRAFYPVNRLATILVVGAGLTAFSVWGLVKSDYHIGTIIGFTLSTSLTGAAAIHLGKAVKKRREITREIEARTAR